MATWIDALASRSGPLLTAATHFAKAHGLEADPPRGVSGLQTLSGLITGARDVYTSDAAEQHFVAGAGAYLGLLLLDHLPSGEHAMSAGEHRLRLGAHGFFDPFAAVAEALEARDTPRALIAAVQRAEAEADGSGPTARVVDALVRALSTRDDVRLLSHFDRRLWLELRGAPIELDLERTIAATSGESDALLAHAVRRLCAALTHEASPLLSWQAAAPLIFPRLVGPSFVNGMPGSDVLHLRQLGPEVWETLVLRYRERSRFVRQAEIETWSKDGAAPRAHALQNLARSSERARFLQHDTAHGPLVVTETRDGLDAARLLLPGLYDVLARSLGSPFIVATPHRDCLLACACAPDELVGELQARTDAAADSGRAHAISRTLWRVSGPGVLTALPAAPGGEA